jgi:glycosyltransferase involved in cell wall biosynthesis
VTICIDATPLDNSNRFRGIGRYVEGLLSGFEELGHEAPIMQLRLAGWSRKSPHVPLKTALIRRPAWLPVRLQWIFNELLLPFAIRQTKATVFHATDPNAIPISHAYKTVITVHDMIPSVFPRDYLTSWIKRWAYRSRLEHYRKADHLIAVSEATRSDIVQFLGIEPSRITVIQEGYDSDLFKPLLNVIPAQHGLPDRFFLYVGAQDARKNIVTLLRAYAKVHKDLQEKLIFSGKLTTRQLMIFNTWVRKLELERDVFNLGFVSSEMLSILYSCATAFVFPSRYEGFGLPVLEALACGCPVIASNSSSIPEVVGDAGILIDVEDDESLALSLHTISHSETLRTQLKGKAIIQASKFSWKRCAEETLRVYRHFFS